MRIALVYDCVHPPSVGGAERWLRALAEDLARDHQVTYITRRQWAAGERPIEGVRCVAVAPGGSLTTAAGRRRVLPPLALAAGVFGHMLRHRRDYDVVHCLSYPYLPLLGVRAGLAGPGGPALVVEWLECLTPEYWRWYAGRLGGAVGRLAQWLCVRATPVAICFSEHTERRLRAAGLQAPVHRLGGLWQAEPPGASEASPAPPGTGAEPLRPPFLLFAGRHVPDKQVTAIPAALALARGSRPDLRAVIVGDGPSRPAVKAEVERLGLEQAVDLPGFVSRERLHAMMGAAACVLAPSRRDGHGMVVAEAAATGTPVIAVAGADTALPELIEEGVNGTVSPSAAPEELASAIGRVLDGGEVLRANTSGWWARNRDLLSAGESIARVRRLYDAELSAGRASL